jgi:hypothetical protein
MNDASIGFRKCAIFYADFRFNAKQGYLVKPHLILPLLFLHYEVELIPVNDHIGSH